jgi:hypothetical protein
MRPASRPSAQRSQQHRPVPRREDAFRKKRQVCGRAVEPVDLGQCCCKPSDEARLVRNRRSRLSLDVVDDEARRRQTARRRYRKPGGLQKLQQPELVRGDVRVASQICGTVAPHDELLGAAVRRLDLEP